MTIKRIVQTILGIFLLSSSMKTYSFLVGKKIIDGTLNDCYMEYYLIKYGPRINGTQEFKEIRNNFSATLLNLDTISKKVTFATEYHVELLSESTVDYKKTARFYCAANGSYITGTFEINPRNNEENPIPRKVLILKGKYDENLSKFKEGEPKSIELVTKNDLGSKLNIMAQWLDNPFCYSAGSSYFFETSADSGKNIVAQTQGKKPFNFGNKNNSLIDFLKLFPKATPIQFGKVGPSSKRVFIKNKFFS